MDIRFLSLISVLLKPQIFTLNFKYPLTLFVTLELLIYPHSNFLKTTSANSLPLGQLLCEPKITLMLIQSMDVIIIKIPL